MICIVPLMFENMHSILHKNDFSFCLAAISMF